MSDLTLAGAGYSSVPVSEENPVPVAIISGGGGGGGSGDASEATLQDILAELELKANLAETQPVSAASLPLPTGAATSALQTTGNAALADLLAELELKADLAETQPVVDGAAGTALGDLNTATGTVNAAAVEGDTNGGSVIARLRGLGKQLAAVIAGTSSFRVTQDESNKVNDEVAAARPECTRYQGTRSASGEASVINAPSAGFHLEIWRLSVQAWEDGAQTVSWREGTGGTDNFSWKLLLDGDGYSPALNGSWHLPTETALYVNTSSANDVRLLVEYRTVADADRA